MAIRVIHSIYLILLMGLVWPVCSVDDGPVWLNELSVVGHTTPGDVVASLEFVGRPRPTSSETAPPTMGVTVKFYDGTTEGSIGEKDLEVELKPESAGGWNDNYVGSYEDSDKTYALAFLRGATIGGISVAYGGQTRVYCWGTAADVGEPVNGSTGTAVNCDTLVIKQHMQESAGLTNVAMYNKASDGTPGDGGTKGDDFSWAMSIQTSGAFETIDEVNKCPSGSSCEADVIDQVLGAFTWEHNVNKDIVWLNEVNVVGAGDAADVEVSLELVGRPVRPSAATAPTTIEATLTFYTGSEAISATQTVTLAPPATSGDWKGNYVGTLEDSKAYGTAFPDDTTAGVKVVYESESRVYCWGSAAKVGEDVGDGVLCDTALVAVLMNGGAGKSVNVAMYNQEDGEPTSGGTKGGDFVWRLSVDTSDASFDTIGDVNACVGTCEDTIVTQVVAVFEWEGAGNNDMVWLNELNVVGDDTPGDVVVSLEVIGRPAQTPVETAPAKMEATVKFYDGTNESPVGDELTVDLTAKTGDGNDNYMGSYEDSDKAYALAFLRGATIGGISVAYGGHTRVYCWGTAADVGEPVNGSTGTAVSCDTLVIKQHMQESAGRTNVAMYNKASDGTPADGGTKGDDFTWAMSIQTSGEQAFETIGEENVCPSGVTCSSDVIAQQVAKYEWEGSSTSTSTSSSTAAASAAVAQRSVASVGLAFAFVAGAM